MRFRALAPLALVLCCGDAGAQNAIQNPDFTTNANSWNAANPAAQTPGGAFVRDADSGSGAPLGAADLQYARPTGAGGGDFSIWNDCLPVAGNASLVYGGQVNVALGGPGATATLALLVYDSNDCSAGFTYNPGIAGTTVAGTVDGAPATYTRMNGAMTTDAGAQSMRMLIAVNPGSNDHPSRVLWDRLFVGPPGTTPAQLVRFSAN